MKGEQRPCTAASPADCACAPAWPQGAYLTAATPFSWRPWAGPAAAAAGGDSSAWLWATERYAADYDPAAATTTVRVLLVAGREMPAGSQVTVARLSGAAAAPPRAAAVNLSACEGYPSAALAGLLDPAAGSLRFQLSAPAASLNFSFRVAGNVSCLACAAAAAPPPAPAPWYWVNASYTVARAPQSGSPPGGGGGGGWRLTVCLLANGLLPPGTAVVLRGVRGLPPGAAPAPATVLANTSAYPAVAQADAAAGTVSLALPAAGAAVCLSLNVSTNASAARATAEAGPAAVDRSLYAPADVPAARLAQVANCAPGALAGTAAQLSAAANRLGRQHLLRWTPGPADAGRTYSVCFRAVSAAGISSPRRCVVLAVRRRSRPATARRRPPPPPPRVASESESLGVGASRRAGLDVGPRVGWVGGGGLIALPRGEEEEGGGRGGALRGPL